MQQQILLELYHHYLKIEMIHIDKIEKVYLLGIGGIGMSALARYFRFLGKQVEGYDKTPSSLTFDLVREGIIIHFNGDLDKVPILAEKTSTLVIYTPAIQESFTELQYFRNNDFQILKRSQVLGIIASDKRCIAIAGTHGKTSVTTMTSHLFRQSELDCLAFMGGISKNYDTNLLLPANKSSFIIVEADEYDRSFLQLNPEIAVITWMDADHLDIYQNVQNVVDAFHDFVSQIKSGGSLIYRSGLSIDKTRNTGIQYYSYSIIGIADFMAKNIHIVNGSYHFDLLTPFGEIEGLTLSYPGLMNVENSVAACAMALISGVKAEEIQRALPQYRGVVRRFDIRYSGKKTVFIDDYAHHPRELEATIKSVRNLYPGKKITGIFQPHLYSRTRDFAVEFAASLDLLDEALLMEIYPAREQPIEGVDTEIILKYMKLKKRIRCDKGDFPEILDQFNPEILLTLGAGDIDRLADPIISWLKNKENV
jgi:UDP-N-acetylmuramate--alanine ligase